jgi:hypothetical protein
MKSIIKLLFAAALTFCAAVYLPQAEPVVAFTGGLLYLVVLTGLVVPTKHLFTGQLNAVTDVAVWNKYIIEKLRKVNDFLFKSKDESGFVLGGATVYIPQAGNDPTVEVNTFTLPGVAAVRVDSDINYVLDYFRTVPMSVPWHELQTISYDKIDSVVGGHMRILAEKVADKMLINWCPAAVTQVLTTGGSGALTQAPATGQTGTRKAFDVSDLAKAMIRMNRDDVPKQGRVCLIDDWMYEGFYNSLSATQFNSFNQFANNETGMVGKLHGFDIYTRSSVVQFASAGTVPEALGSALDATDNLASLCWQVDCVAAAIGETKLFTNVDDPLYYGNLYSAIVRAGGRSTRTDKKGIIAIVQAP